MGCSEQHGQRLACRIARIGRTRPKLVGSLHRARRTDEESADAVFLLRTVVRSTGIQTSSVAAAVSCRFITYTP